MDRKEDAKVSPHVTKLIESYEFQPSKLDRSNFLVPGTSVAPASATTRSWCGRTRHTSAADGPSSSTEVSRTTSRTSWCATTDLRLTSGEKLLFV